jgi:hypothetical protein
MSSNIPKPNATITDGIEYVKRNPSSLVTIFAGLKELVTVLLLIFKPAIKSPNGK